MVKKTTFEKCVKNRRESQEDFNLAWRPKNPIRIAALQDEPGARLIGGLYARGKPE